MSYECFRYGIGHGCDGNCPVLMERKCEFDSELIYLLNEWMDFNVCKIESEDINTIEP